MKVNLLLRDFIGRLAAAPGTRGRRAPAGALHLLADRPRPRAAGRRDRRRAANASPRSRDRLAGATSGHRGSRGPRRADPPGQRGAGERVRPYGVRVGRARSALLPGAARMDEILLANFMVFHDLVGRALRPVDRRRGLGARLLPAREPRAEVGRLRVADRLRRLAADGRRRRARGGPDRRLQRRDDRADRPLPALRDRAIFVGDPDDIVPERFGDELPSIRDWTEQHYDFSGYITGFDPAASPIAARCGRARLRRRRAGLHRHRRRLRRRRGPAAPSDRASPHAKRLVPELRMIAVAGPRIDPGRCRRIEGLEVRALRAGSATATSRRATSRSSRAGSRPGWS